MDISTMSFNYYRFEPSPYDLREGKFSKRPLFGMKMTMAITAPVYADLI